jgi:ribose transport system substrate-binding protein
MKLSKRTLLAAGAAAFLAATSPAIAELKPTRGPNGEDPTPAKELVLTPEQETKVKEGKFVAELGLADPTKAEDVLNALILKHPNLDGVYATWSTPAEAILAALRNAGNAHIKIVTFDPPEPLALDMAKGGNVPAIVADQPYQIGVTGTRAVATGLLKQSTKPCYAVEALTVTKDTIKRGYIDSQHREPLATVMGQ